KEKKEYKDLDRLPQGMCGPWERYCCSACRHGRSQRWCEQTVVVDSSQKRGPEQTMCAHTACFKASSKLRGRWEARSPLSIRSFYPLEGQSGEPVVFSRSQQVHGRAFLVFWLRFWLEIKD